VRFEENITTFELDQQSIQTLKSGGLIGVEKGSVSYKQIVPTASSLVYDPAPLKEAFN